MASPSDSLKKELLQAQNERVGRNSTKRQPHLIYLGVVRAIMRISLTVTLTCCSGTMATAADDLYRAQAIVTGQGEANRNIGFASCLEDVLIKVSGAQKLAGDRRLAAYKSNAKDFVRAFSYHDQMSGTPTRDEQGTRDRPYDLSSGSGFLTIKTGPRPSPKPAPRFARSDLLRELVCDECGRDYGVYAISLFCPDCGAPNIHLHFAREVVLVRDQVELAGKMDSERQELAY